MYSPEAVWNFQINTTFNKTAVIFLLLELDGNFIYVLYEPASGQNSLKSKISNFTTAESKNEYVGMDIFE